MISPRAQRTATTVAESQPHLCMNSWCLSRQNFTQLCFTDHKIEVSRQRRKRIFFFGLGSKSGLKRKRKELMEGESSKFFNIPKPFENSMNISLYKEAYFTEAACKTTRTVAYLTP